MSIPYSADEIFEMAEQIERNGASFYRRAAELAQRADVRDLLNELAKMEDSHEAMFASLRAQLSAEASQASTFDPYGEMSLYLQAAADTHIFNVRKDVRELLTGKETIEDILNMAIGFEKDSIVFFLGMHDYVPENLGKKEMGVLVEQEMQHLTDLSKQLAALR